MAKKAGDHVPRLLAVELRLEKLVAGLLGAISKETKVHIAGSVKTGEDLLSEAKFHLAFHKAVHEAKAAHEAAVGSRRADSGATRDFIRHLDQVLVELLPAGSPILAALGYVPPAPRAKLTSEQLKAKADKLRETRRRLHIMGPRQKQALLASLSEEDPVTPGPTNGSAPEGSGTAK